MTTGMAQPLIVLRRRLDRLGRLLSGLCMAWIAAVGLDLTLQLTPDDLEHHRAPTIQDRVHQCEGDYADRYNCTEAVLLDGQRGGAEAVLLRLVVTMALPAVAWGVWSVVMRRTRRLLWGVGLSDRPLASDDDG